MCEESRKILPPRLWGQNERGVIWIDHCAYGVLCCFKRAEFKIKRSLRCWNIMIYRKWKVKCVNCVHTCLMGGVSYSHLRRNRKSVLLHLSSLKRRVRTLCHRHSLLQLMLLHKEHGEECVLKLPFQIHSNTMRSLWSHITFHFVWFFFQKAVWYC